MDHFDLSQKMQQVESFKVKYIRVHGCKPDHQAGVGAGEVRSWWRPRGHKSGAGDVEGQHQTKGGVGVDGGGGPQPSQCTNPSHCKLPSSGTERKGSGVTPSWRRR